MPTFAKTHIAHAWPVLRAAGLLSTVTYHHKSSPTAGVSTSSVTLYLHGYRKEDLDSDVILRTDLRGILPADDIAFQPTQYDEWVHSDTRRFRVLRAMGEPGQAFHLLHCRQVAA